MIDTHLRQVARALLQAKVDNNLKTPGQAINLMGKYAPKGGWGDQDMRKIARFCTEMATTDSKVMAQLHNLEIVF